MAITETTILGGVVALLSTIGGWLFKRQIDRIDELERRHNEGNVNRAEMARDIKYIREKMDAIETRLG